MQQHLSELQKKVLSQIEKDGSLTNEQYAQLTGTSIQMAKRCIKNLVKKGYLKPYNNKGVNKREPLVVIAKPSEQIKVMIHQPEPEVAGVLKKALQSGKRLTVFELSEIADISPNKVKSGLSQLIDEGYNISFDGDAAMFTTVIPKKEPTKISVSQMSTGSYKFGAIGDMHLGSKYERLDVLNSLYNYFYEQGITTVFNTGNWIDGEARFNKHDLHTHGLGNQIQYFIDNYPQKEGMKTLYVSGDDHEGWYVQREGIDIGQFAEQRAMACGREDLKYIGHMEADVHLKAKNGETIIRVQHPGGGSAYAISYTSQKIVESLTGNEKPHLLLIGHYHKAEYIYVRGVHVLQTGCVQDQTPFMRKKRLSAHVGGWVVEFSTDDNGAITRIKTEFIPFYDKEYYGKWKYQWG